jgi:hypothetical protein
MLRDHLAANTGVKVSNLKLKDSLQIAVQNKTK